MIRLPSATLRSWFSRMTDQRSRSSWLPRKSSERPVKHTVVGGSTLIGIWAVLDAPLSSVTVTTAV